MQGSNLDFARISANFLVRSVMNHLTLSAYLFRTRRFGNRTTSQPCVYRALGVDLLPELIKLLTKCCVQKLGFFVKIRRSLGKNETLLYKFWIRKIG